MFELIGEVEANSACGGPALNPSAVQSQILDQWDSRMDSTTSHCDHSIPMVGQVKQSMPIQVLAPPMSTPIISVGTNTAVDGRKQQSIILTLKWAFHGSHDD